MVRPGVLLCGELVLRLFQFSSSPSNSTDDPGAALRRPPALCAGSATRMVTATVDRDLADGPPIRRTRPASSQPATHYRCALSAARRGGGETRLAVRPCVQTASVRDFPTLPVTDCLQAPMLPAAGEVSCISMATAEAIASRVACVLGCLSLALLAGSWRPLSCWLGFLQLHARTILPKEMQRNTSDACLYIRLAICHIPTLSPACLHEPTPHPQPDYHPRLTTPSLSCSRLSFSLLPPPSIPFRKPPKHNRR